MSGTTFGSITPRIGDALSEELESTPFFSDNATIG
jgi:hypothetical protein